MQGGDLGRTLLPLYLLVKNHVPPVILFLLSKDIKIFFEEFLKANPPPKPKRNTVKCTGYIRLRKVLKLLQKLKMTCSRGGAGTRHSTEISQTVGLV